MRSSLTQWARALGGEVTGRQVLAPGPGHSAKDRSLAVQFDPQAPDGFICYSHARDDWRACRDHVRARLGLPSDGKSSRRREDCARPSGKSLPTADPGRTARALALWSEATAPGGTLVEAYLTGRGLQLPAEAAGEAIRFHPECPFRLDDGSTAKIPAMIALMRNAVTDEPQAIHRTALGEDGDGKARVVGLRSPKMMLGPSRGAVVKLVPDADVDLGLGLAEGIETAISIIAGGWRPVCACGTAGTISTFPVLGGIEALTIFADADPAGLTAAQSCQARWLAAGRECTIILPPDDGQDWADVVGVRP